MSKICAKCSKAVYPLEELKCLEKIWHKGCFKCWECGMILSMKNYKGYDKKPYCVAHYPQTKATVVADTPEMARIAHNTKIQSQVKYHEEFEKMKGSKIEVADDLELKRVKRIGSVVSQIEYKGQREKTASMEARRQSLPHSSNSTTIETVNTAAEDYKPSPYSNRATSHSTVYSSGASKVVNPPVARRVGSIADYDPMNDNYGSLNSGYHPTSRSNSMSQEWEETVPISPSATFGHGHPEQPPLTEDVEEASVNDRTLSEQNESDSVDHVDSQQSHVEMSSHDDDIFHGESSSHNDDISPVRSSSHNDDISHVELSSHEDNNLSHVDDESNNGTCHVEPVSANAADEVELPSTNAAVETEHDDIEQSATVEQSATTVEEPDVAAEQKVASADIYRAVYSYEAQDEDEVGFNEGDKILDTEFVAEGWMMGTVERTGERGMMPSNYVEKCTDE